MRAVRSWDVVMCMVALAGCASSGRALAQGGDAAGGPRSMRVDRSPTRSELAERLGPPGSPAFRAAVEDVKRRIAAGTMDARPSPFDAAAMGLETLHDGAPGIDGVGTPAAGAPDGRSARSVGAPVSFAYFDGFETYGVWTAPATHPIPTPSRFSAQSEPSGQAVAASSMFAVTTLPQPAYTDGDWTYSPAAPLGRNPYNPGGVGGYPVDREPAIEQALMNGTGSRVHALGDAGRLSSYFLGYRIHENGLYAPRGAMGTQQARPVIVCQDWWFADGEYGDCWSPSSTLEGFIVSRVCMLGYGSSPNGLTEPDAKMLRPQVLGASLGFDLADFFSPPTDPAPGLPTFHTKTGEWFSVAMRLSLDSIEWFVRDSGTDGSKGILIDDARDLPFFETGWASIFPGEDAGFVSDSGGVATWRGYGQAVTEFGERTYRPSRVYAAITVDNCFTIVGGDPSATRLPDWRPANWWTDNHIIIGARFVQSCFQDINADGAVDAGDLSFLLSAWGPTLGTPADIDGDGVVGPADLALLLGAWGPCP